ncbi:MAG: hypothetical protein FWD87_08925 [Spirochaetaceae bacterium]|nr:hypothetical protein [Spirochaetaceae bacterium]
MARIFYVAFNKRISNPETKEMPYKIGITGTNRYFDFEELPGQIEILFAYSFKDYKTVDAFFHHSLEQYRIKDQWFNLNQEQLNLIKLNCESMGGIDVKNKFEKKYNKS